MTTHELAKLLLAMPNVTVVDDSGFPISSASVYFGGRIVRADDGAFHSYAFPPQPTDSPVARDFFDGLSKEEIAIIS